MTDVKFYHNSEIADSKLRFAVIAARYDDKWIFCRHRERSSWEIPGGHREDGETIEETARRELYEETGAKSFTLRAVTVYSFDSYGMLFYAEISELGSIPDNSEIAEIELFDVMPKELTYPQIQPALYSYIQGWLFLQDFSLDDIVLQEGETCGARYVDSDELRALSERGELVPYRYLDRLLDDVSM